MAQATIAFGAGTSPPCAPSRAERGASVGLAEKERERTGQSKSLAAGEPEVPAAPPPDEEQRAVRSVYAVRERQVRTEPHSYGFSRAEPGAWAASRPHSPRLEAPARQLRPGKGARRDLSALRQVLSERSSDRVRRSNASVTRSSLRLRSRRSRSVS